MYKVTTKCYKCKKAICYDDNVYNKENNTWSVPRTFIRDAVFDNEKQEWCCKDCNSKDLDTPIVYK